MKEELFTRDEVRDSLIDEILVVMERTDNEPTLVFCEEYGLLYFSMPGADA